MENTFQMPSNCMTVYWMAMPLYTAVLHWWGGCGQSCTEEAQRTPAGSFIDASPSDDRPHTSDRSMETSALCAQLSRFLSDVWVLKPIKLSSDVQPILSDTTEERRTKKTDEIRWGSRDITGQCCVLESNDDIHPGAVCRGEWDTCQITQMH